MFSPTPSREHERHGDTHPMTAPKFRPLTFGVTRVVVRDGAPGVRYLKAEQALKEHPARLTDRLKHWADTAPERTFMARRLKRADGSSGDWRHVTYGEAWASARAIAQGLINRGLSAERPVVILSENDLEHALLALGCLVAGVPYVPTSPPYSLVSTDFSKLRHVLETVTPGLVFAADGARYGRAIGAVVGTALEVVLTAGELPGRPSTAFADLLATEPTPGVDVAMQATGPDTIAKFLFTSGSTKLPKAVINTQGMWCANQQQMAQSMPVLAEAPPVLVDWLPWNHTFGGNHNVGLTLYNGGTLYIDDGKPTPKGIATTLRNLREISPTVYFNVPKGFEEIAFAMDSDTTLRDSLFKRCKAFMFAGAGLSQAVWDKLDAHGEAAVGERVRIITGLGMTETAPSCTFAVGTDVRSGHIGLPVPGVEAKLVKDASTGDKMEIRFKGPNVMPGYWRAPEQTREAFDDEGFYRTGDAAKLIDPHDVNKGFIFDGRTAEDFKLSTGTFVSVGPLRAKIILAGEPLVQDAVITGLNRDDVGAMLFPRPDECRKLAGVPDAMPFPEVLHHPTIRAFFQGVADRLWKDSTGSANRVARVHVLAEPPSIDKGEVTDKNSINQRAVLQHRDALVQALYEGSAADPFLILPNKA